MSALNYIGQDHFSGALYLFLLLNKEQQVTLVQDTRPGRAAASSSLSS